LGKDDEERQKYCCFVEKSSMYRMYRFHDFSLHFTFFPWERSFLIEKHEVAQKMQSKNPDFWKELITIKINQLKNSGSNIICFGV
jgi:hypothetical protein